MVKWRCSLRVCTGIPKVDRTRLNGAAVAAIGGVSQIAANAGRMATAIDRRPAYKIILNEKECKAWKLQVEIMYNIAASILDVTQQTGRFGMHYRPRLRMFSSVGGGPLERMTRRMSGIGLDAKLCAALTPEAWRGLFRRGRGGRLFARALTFGAYPFEALASACLASLKAKPLEKPILVATTNPFFLPHFLVATKALHRCGVVALMYDMYPDALEAAGVDKKWLSKLMTAANRWMLSRADGVVYLGEMMQASSEARYGANPKTWVIPNGADPEEFSESRVHADALDADLRAWMDGRVIFSYVGNMGLMHDVETLERAVPALLSREGVDRSRIGFVIAASGPGEARLREAWTGLDDCVRFVGPQKDDAWAALLYRTDVALATLTEKAHATSAPSKIYSALAANCVPLVVAPDNSDLAALVCTCGDVVAPGDVDGLVAAMARLTDVITEAGEAAKTCKTRVLQALCANDIDAVGELWTSCFESIVDSLAKPWGTAIYHAAKRAFDVAAVSAGLALVWPLMALTAIGVRVNLGSPVLFRQQRPGLDGKPFELLKFRSMANAPAGTDASHDGERLSEFGKKIRALSLDELPTLLNVLKGDMSLVGPRPLLMSYLERYDSEQIRRQWAKPGVTGWAQVNGRNALSWEEKFKYDVWYVDHASASLDLKILLLTVWTVLRRSGIQHAGSATMPEFMGNKSDE